MKINFLILILFVCSNIYAQNIKKIYKNIQRNEFNNAIEEINEFKDLNSLKTNEKILLNLGKCLVYCNPETKNFNPTDSYKIYNSIIIQIKDNDITEVNDFLIKYDLSFESVNDSINKGIYIEAKQINSVLNYKNAIKICKACKYKSELEKLEAKSAYEEVKKQISINSLNTFINDYPNSSYKNEAVNNRDSIVFNNIRKTYDEYLSFTKEYPNSIYTPKILKELPDILYRDVLDKNTLESYNNFMSLYPNDTRINNIKELIKKTHFVEISFSEVNKVLDCNSVRYLNKIEGIDSIYSVSVNGKIGIINKHGNTIIPFIYDYINYIGDYHLIVLLNGKYGIINYNGDIILPIIYKKIKNVTDEIVLIENEGKKGVFNLKVNQIIPTMFDDIICYKQDEIIKVKSKGKEGILDFKGKELLSCVYDEIDYLGGQFAISSLSGKKAIFNLTSFKTVSSQVKYDDLFLVPENGIIIFKSNNKYGVIDGDGKIIISSKFDDITWMDKGIFEISLNNKFGIIDINEKEIIPILYSNISFLDETNSFFKVKLNEKFGLFDKFGNVITPIIYDDIFTDLEVYNNEKYGLINANGKIILPTRFDNIYRKNGFIITRINNKYGVWDEDGKEVVLPIYDEIKIDDNFFIVKLNHKYGVIDKSSNQIIQPIYEQINIMEIVSLAEVRINDKVGIIDLQGKEIVPLIYDEIQALNKDLIRVQLNNAVGIIDRHGKEIVEIGKFDDFNLIDDNQIILIANLNNKLGFIDKNGNEISDIKYQLLEQINSHLLFVFDDCKLKCIKLNFAAF